MSTKLSLKRPARRRLQKLDRNRPSADVRVCIRMILKVAAGLSCNAAAREVSCVPSTAVRIVTRFMREGEESLLDHRSENGTRKVDDDVRGRVREILAGRPSDHGFERPTRALEILRAVIAEVAGVACRSRTSGDWRSDSGRAGGVRGRSWRARGAHVVSSDGSRR